MQEIFYEESAGMRNKAPARRMYKIFTIAGAICLIFAVMSLLFALTTPVGEEGFTRSVVIVLIMWLALCAVMTFGGVFLLRRRHTFFLEFDYTFVSGELRISKVIHERRRKLMYKLGDEKLIKIGRYGSESYKKLKASPDNREDILTPNNEAAEDKEFFYIQAMTAVGKRILVIECRLQMIYTIVRFMNRNILESEFNRK